MNRNITILGGFAFFILLLFLLCSIHLENRYEEMYNDSLMSNYEYDITIESNRTLKNVILYLPVPVFENESKIGLEMVEGNYYNKPFEWNLSLEDTEYGLMFKIEAAEIRPTYHSLLPGSSLPAGLKAEQKYHHCSHYISNRKSTIHFDRSSGQKSEHRHQETYHNEHIPGFRNQNIRD